jgi:hypothetical protein
MATKTETLTATCVNGETGEVIERPLTADELADIKASKKDYDAKQAAAEAKANARESALAKLADLGLSAEEIAAL